MRCLDKWRREVTNTDWNAKHYLRYGDERTRPSIDLDWIASTGLRPFLSVLSEETECNAFVAQLRGRVHEAYRPQVDGKVLFPFRRTFVVAYR